MRRALLLSIVIVALPRGVCAQGSPVGPQFQVNSYTTNLQGYPSVVADAAGNFVVVWQSNGQDGGFQGIFGQRYGAGGTPLGPEFLVNTFTPTPQIGPAAATGAAGNFIVVWTSNFQDDGLSAGVFGQRYASSGVPLGPEFRVNTYTTDFQGGAMVAADPAGNFIVVWNTVQIGAGIEVFGQRFTAAGVPLGTEFQINTYSTFNQWHPAVAADGSGNFVVVWASEYQDGSDFGIYAQRFASSGVPIGPEFRVNTFTTLEQDYLSVAADATGNFIVVWQSNTQDGSDSAVLGQRYASSGVPIGPEFRINTFTTSFQGRPRVVADASGNFVVTWMGYAQDTPFTFGVFGQRYDSTGTPRGPEFRVNAYTTDMQTQPSVAADPTGNFVVVWQTRGLDGSDYAVFGQRYSPIVPVELMHLRVE